jgi:hypothetical protein
VEIADTYGVGVAPGALGGFGGGPDADAGDFAEEGSAGLAAQGYGVFEAVRDGGGGDDGAAAGVVDAGEVPLPVGDGADGGRGGWDAWPRCR